MNNMKIGEVSKMLNIPISTIRDWSDQGILQPVKTETGHRLYNIEDVVKVKESLTGPKEKVNYLEKMKKDIENKKIKMEELKNEIKMFENNDLGMHLSISEKNILNLDNDCYRNFVVVSQNGQNKKKKIIFLATHENGDVFLFRSLAHKEFLCKPNGLDESQNNDLKVRSLKAGSISDVMEAFVCHLSNNLVLNNEDPKTGTLF